MSKLRMAASTVGCIIALLSGQAVAAGGPQCWQPYEVEAAKVRDLHIMLMLGTLKCQAAKPEIASKYDAFVQKKNGQLANYNNVLKARFMRANGIADGQRAYEEFNTKLGNTHSGNAQPSNICEITESLLMLATNAGSDELPMLARSFSETELGLDEDCTQVATAVASPHEAVAAAAAPAAVSAAAPVEVANTDTTAAQPQSAAAALEAAAAALQNAAASLKAQPAAPAAETANKQAELPVAKPAVVPVSTAANTPTS